MQLCNFSRIDGNKFDSLYTEGGLSNTASAVKRGGSLEKGIAAFVAYNPVSRNFVIRIEEVSGKAHKIGSENGETPRNAIMLMEDDLIGRLLKTLPPGRREEILSAVTAGSKPELKAKQAQ